MPSDYVNWARTRNWSKRWFRGSTKPMPALPPKQSQHRKLRRKQSDKRPCRRSAGAHSDFGLARPINRNIQLSQIEWPEVLRRYGLKQNAKKTRIRTPRPRNDREAEVYFRGKELFRLLTMVAQDRLPGLLGCWFGLLGPFRRAVYRRNRWFLARFPRRRVPVLWRR